MGNFVSLRTFRGQILGYIGRGYYFGSSGYRRHSGYSRAYYCDSFNRGCFVCNEHVHLVRDYPRCTNGSSQQGSHL